MNACNLNLLLCIIAITIKAPIIVFNQLLNTILILQHSHFDCIILIVVLITYTYLQMQKQPVVIGCQIKTVQSVTKLFPAKWSNEILSLISRLWTGIVVEKNDSNMNTTFNDLSIWSQFHG